MEICITCKSPIWNELDARIAYLRVARGEGIEHYPFWCFGGGIHPQREDDLGFGPLLKRIASADLLDHGRN